MNIRTPDEERSFTFNYVGLAIKAAQILNKIKNGRPLNQDENHKLGLVKEFIEGTIKACRFWKYLLGNDRAALGFSPSAKEEQDYEAFSLMMKLLPKMFPGLNHESHHVRGKNFLYRVWDSVEKRLKGVTSAEVMEELTQAIAFFRKMHDEMNRRYGIANDQCAEFDDAE